MNVMYKSTRSDTIQVTASEAILKGLSPDGGLFLPAQIPKLDLSISEIAKMSYQETAYEVMKLFFTDFTQAELKDCIQKAYDSKFDTEEIAVIKKADNAYFLELFHGATVAFKDMALSILPYLLSVSAKKNQISKEIVILTATSGDTGKAALAGFADVEGTKILVFYPKNGVSPIQEKQMVTQKGKNTYVIGIEGNFDDAQQGVKEMFHNKELAEKMDKAGYQFSSANSINIGRLIPQVVYYVYAYSRLLKKLEIARNEEINITVPTGNFGNILAAYYAKQMGVPIKRLVCASNENKVLYDFFRTGIYDKNRKFIVTSSPSMDILISSNLERLIYQLTGEDPVQTAAFMESLAVNGTYTITEQMQAKLADFAGGFADEQKVAKTIHRIYELDGYIIDPHTAVAASVSHTYQSASGDQVKMLIVSTASPFKFTRSVMNAINRKYDSMTDFALIDELSGLSGVKVPQAIEDIRSARVLHTQVCAKDKMQETVEKILKI